MQAETSMERCARAFGLGGATALVLALAAGCGGGMMGKKMMMTPQQIMKMDKTKMPHDRNVHVTIQQEPGKVVYWILPGPRKLSPSVFGTPDHPLRTAAIPEAAPPPIKALLKKLPILIGVPPMMRGVSEDGSRYTMTKMPTPFSDKGVPVKGELSMDLWDRTGADGKGPPPMTPDDAKATIRFTDPAGNQYEARPLFVVKPPVPGYETAGGVLIDSYHHGSTGTGTPLMPKVYTYAAFWAFGNLSVNGKVVDKMKLIHCMTTETVRDKNYKLPVDEDLPLAIDDTINGQAHHTHCVILPVKMTPKGPVHDPVKTAFKLPNGMNQPFIHIMYEQDSIVRGPDWTGPHPESVKRAGGGE